MGTEIIKDVNEKGDAIYRLADYEPARSMATNLEFVTMGALENIDNFLNVVDEDYMDGQPYATHFSVLKALIRQGKRELEENNNFLKNTVGNIQVDRLDHTDSGSFDDTSPDYGKILAICIYLKNGEAPQTETPPEHSEGLDD